MGRREAQISTYMPVVGWTLALMVTAVLAAAPSAGAQQGLGPEAEVTRSDETGKVVFVGTEPGDPVSRPAGIDTSSTAAEAALAYLRQNADAFGVSGDELTVTDSSRSPGGATVRFQQRVEGVRVLGGELIVNLTDRNEILSVSGEALPLGDIDSEPDIGADAAVRTAISSVADETGAARSDLANNEPKLFIYDSSLFGGDGATSLTWAVEVYSPTVAGIGKRVLVDANSGRVVKVFELVHQARNRRICENANARTAITNCSAGVLVEGGNYTGGVADVQEVYDFSGQTYDFYNTRWGRDSIDGAGMDMRSTVRFCTNTTQPAPAPPNTFVDACPYRNAFFQPFMTATFSQAFYGDGVGSDDIVAHEVTHGVTQFESGLVYQNESGAINESLSDVFGEALDLVNGQGTDTAATRWQIGEDSSLGVDRDMSDPPLRNNPDKMTSSEWGFTTGDNGGVHDNSGVSNKAAFLLTDGETFNTYTVSPIGLEKMLRVYYEAQVNLLTSGSDYGALGNALNQACTNLVGTAGIVAADCTQVNNAVLATEMATEAAAPDTTITSGPGQATTRTPTWTFTDNRPGTATFECSIDQGTPSWSACSGPGGSHTPSSNLADGTYTFRVRGRIGSDVDPTPDTRSVTIPPRLSIDDVTVTEGDSGTRDANFTVSLSSPPPGTVTVDYATQGGGSDIQATSGTLTFTGGQTSKTITVKVNGDIVDELDETFEVKLSNASSALIDDDTGRGTIRDDDEAKLSIDDVTVTEGNTGTVNATFTVSSTNPADRDIKADYTTVDDTATQPADYVKTSGTLVIGPLDQTGKITVPVKGDTIDEIDQERYFVDLSNPVVASITDNRGIGTIVDDDRNGRFTCRATGARVGGLTESPVANPANDPCVAGSERLTNPTLGSFVAADVLHATSAQTPADLTSALPAAGDNGRSHAEATQLTLRVGFNVIVLSSLTSDARAQCGAGSGKPTLTGSSRVALLSVNGRPVLETTASANLPLIAAVLRLNQTVTTATGVTQRALVIEPLIGPDIVIGEARAGWVGTPVHPNGHPCAV